MAGLFIQNHEKHEKYVQNHTSSNNPFGVSGCNYGGLNFGELAVSGITSGASLFFQYWGEGKGAIDSESVQVDEATQKLIDQKTQELTTVLAPANAITQKSAESSKQLSKHITGFEKDITKLESKVSGDKSSASIQKLINEYFDENGNPKTVTNENGEEVAIDTKGYDYNKLNKQLEDAKSIEADIKTKKEQLVQLNTIKGQTENIEIEIERLYNSGSSPEIEYDVAQETKDISDFMTKLKAFQTNPNVTTAQALKDSYTNDGSNKDKGIQQASVVKAYSMVSDKVDNILKQKTN